MKTAEYVEQWRSMVKAELELLQHCSAKNHAGVEDEAMMEVIGYAVDEAAEEMRERCELEALDELDSCSGDLPLEGTASRILIGIRALPLPGDEGGDE